MAAGFSLQKMALGAALSPINPILKRLNKKLALSTLVCCSAECSAVDFATVLCTVVEIPSHAHCAASELGVATKKIDVSGSLSPPTMENRAGV